MGKPQTLSAQKNARTQNEEDDDATTEGGAGGERSQHDIAQLRAQALVERSYDNFRNDNVAICSLVENMSDESGDSDADTEEI